jgi:hypothetical protein
MLLARPTAVNLGYKIDILELMDFGSMHPKIISLTTSAMAKH